MPEIVLHAPIDVIVRNRGVSEELRIIKTPDDFPVIEKAEMKRVNRAIHHTAHAKRTIVIDLNPAFFVQVNRLVRTVFQAKIAMDAFLFLGVRKPGIDRRGDPFDSQKPRKNLVTKRITRLSALATGQTN